MAPYGGREGGIDPEEVLFEMGPRDEEGIHNFIKAYEERIRASDATVTDGPGDGGVDLESVITRSDGTQVTWKIQVKSTKSPASLSDMRDFVGRKHDDEENGEPATHYTFYSIRGFSDDAREFGERNDVDLVNAGDIVDKLRERKIMDLMFYPDDDEIPLNR